MLELDGLPRRFGGVVALDDLTFSVAPGRTFGFVGPNGAGKTTAMRIILDVLDPDAGVVRWKARRSTPQRAPASATCPRSAACTRRCGARPARLLRAAPRTDRDRGGD